MDIQDKLIFGKCPTERITSIEVKNDQIQVFIEDGPTQTLPNKYWILANKPINSRFVKMKGDLHYKYGCQFTDEATFLKMRLAWKRQHDIFSIFDSKEAAMVKDGITLFKGMKLADLSVLSFDIESTSLAHDHTAKALIISNTFRKHGQITRKLFCYDEYATPGEMLQAWCAWVREVNPSVILGHNIYDYDLPYLSYLASQYGVTLDLGRDSSPLHFDSFESKFRKDATQYLHYHRPRIYGREIIDTMFLSIKYDIGRSFPNYRLKDIVAFLGKEVPGRQFYEADQIRNRYHIPEEWEKIKKYALHDADDALTLFDIMVPPFFYLTQTVPKPFQTMIESASGSQINAVMIRSYLQDAHSLPKASEAAAYEGAISHGVPGIYSNAFKIDVASLYPSIMIEYNVCDKTKDPQAYFPHLVKTFTEKRLYHKSLAKTDQYHDDLQAAYKIFINSCYGFLGAKGLLFNSPDNAAFVTRKGREVLITAIEHAEKKKYEQWRIDNNIVDEKDDEEGDGSDE